MREMKINHIIEFDNKWEDLKNGIKKFVLLNDKNIQIGDIIIVHKATMIDGLEFIDNKGNKTDNMELSEILSFNIEYFERIQNSEYVICGIKDNIAFFETI